MSVGCGNPFGAVYGACVWLVTKSVTDGGGASQTPPSIAFWPSCWRGVEDRGHGSEKADIEFVVSHPIHKVCKRNGAPAPGLNSIGILGSEAQSH